MYKVLNITKEVIQLAPDSRPPPPTTNNYPQVPSSLQGPFQPTIIGQNNNLGLHQNIFSPGMDPNTLRKKDFFVYKNHYRCPHVGC